MSIKPPVAKKINHVHSKHDHERIDPYHWMRDRDAPEVIQYLEEENDYYEQMTAHTTELKNSLFEEIKARIKEDDQSVPYLYNGYWYFTKMEQGESYPFYYRRKDGTDEDILLFNVNEMAEGHEFYKLVGLNISPNNNLVAYGVDSIGRREYSLFVKDLSTGQIKEECVLGTTGSSVWANDNATLFFARKDPQTLRANKIYRYLWGQPVDSASVVYEEKDETFSSFVYKTMSEKYIMIKSSSTMSDEVRYIEAAKPDSTFKVIQSRVPEMEYSVSHYQDSFYMMTNKDGAFNFKVMKTMIETPQMENWVDVIPHDPKSLLEDIDIFKKYLVITDRFNGLNRIRIKAWDGTVDYFLPFSSETYTAYTSANFQFENVWLRYAYNSLTTPPSIMEFNMDTQEERVLKTQPIEDPDFDPNNYDSQRVWATASDGKRIPISLVYRKDLKQEDGNPLLQYGYGSYGSTIDPYFSISRLSLLDRGFVFAIAHVRGGEYLGREWYEQGRMFEKRNTFTDFIACSEYLLDHAFAKAGHLYASGGSAGGLLMGAIMNLAPHLYNGILAAVPFVDVVTTMLDDTIPLTTGEYDEWGNPNNKDSYEYMLSYSPYDQVSSQSYPNTFVTTGYHDSQVQYWEPAKWVARLREYHTGDQQILFKTDMSSGHSGASGRYDALKEVALEFAFLLDLENQER
ncbi:S9 family peptidase [Nonlabens ponticola]|uniref:S9 family peptidase n=1 Tax=Nonlabens ponticola TaxID=2496866 RepID=A0A3S9MZ26_9FLAO|nr:S9 family peptidase [Nonlabens ponticola]AZQ44516.1 S9 family peptidase [Nonlabens ponticola]